MMSSFIIWLSDSKLSHTIITEPTSTVINIDWKMIVFEEPRSPFFKFIDLLILSLKERDKEVANDIWATYKKKRG